MNAYTILFWLVFIPLEFALCWWAGLRIQAFFSRRYPSETRVQQMRFWAKQFQADLARAKQLHDQGQWAECEKALNRVELADRRFWMEANK